MRPRPGLLAALALLVGLTVAAGPAAAQPGPAPAPPAKAPVDNCAACHLSIGDERLEAPAKAFPDDIHRTKGFGCVACHGGDAGEEGMEAMDPAKGYIGVPARQDIPQLCGRCHSDANFMRQYNPSLRIDQVTEYFTSVHGRRLRQLRDPKVAVCTSCHPAHSIRPPVDATSSVHPLRVAETCGRCHGDAKYMAGYKIPTDQLEKYKTSIHWQTMSVKGDLSAPTCNDCHGNHGATPPGISWVGNVCGQCHAVMADLFKTSRHARVFVEMGTPGCATCHENHAIKGASDAMLGLAPEATCAACHAADDAGGKAATEMRRLIDTLATDTGKARALLERAEHAGMEVSQAQFDLNGAQEALVKARAAVHAFAVPAVTKEVEPGLTVAEKAYQRGLQALDELAFRRGGLGVSLVIILVVIGGLVVKIRQLDRRKQAGHPPDARGERHG